MSILMRDMFVPRTAQFALVVELALVQCLGCSPWSADRIIATRQQHIVFSRVRKYLNEKSGCNGNLGRAKENINSLERILSVIRLTETAVAIER
jgi:hypothetical protein